MIEVAPEPAPVTYAKAATIDKVITKVASAGVETKSETLVQPVVMRKAGLDAAKKRRQAAVQSINNPMERVSGRVLAIIIRHRAIILNPTLLGRQTFNMATLTRLVIYSASWALVAMYLAVPSRTAETAYTVFS